MVLWSKRGKIIFFELFWLLVFLKGMALGYAETVYYGLRLTPDGAVNWGADERYNFYLIDQALHDLNMAISPLAGTNSQVFVIDKDKDAWVRKLQFGDHFAYISYATNLGWFNVARDMNFSYSLWVHKDVNVAGEINVLGELDAHSDARFGRGAGFFDLNVAIFLANAENFLLEDDGDVEVKGDLHCQGGEFGFKGRGWLGDGSAPITIDGTLVSIESNPWSIHTGGNLDTKGSIHTEASLEVEGNYFLGSSLNSLGILKGMVSCYGSLDISSSTRLGIGNNHISGNNTYWRFDLNDSYLQIRDKEKRVILEVEEERHHFRFGSYSGSGEKVAFGRSMPGKVFVGVGNCGADVQINANCSYIFPKAVDENFSLSLPLSPTLAGATIHITEIAIWYYAQDPEDNFPFMKVVYSNFDGSTTTAIECSSNIGLGKSGNQQNEVIWSGDYPMVQREHHFLTRTSAENPQDLRIYQIGITWHTE